MGGFVAGFLLEYHYVRVTPMPVSWRGQAVKAAVGLSGVLLLLAIDWVGGEVGGVTAAGAALWATLGAPVVFIWMGFAERSRPVALRRVTISPLRVVPCGPPSAVCGPQGTSSV